MDIVAAVALVALVLLAVLIGCLLVDRSARRSALAPDRRGAAADPGRRPRAVLTQDTA